MLLRPSELPSLSALVAVDEDGFLIEPSPAWSLHDDKEDDLDGPSFRSLIEDPEVLSRAWKATSTRGR